MKLPQISKVTACVVLGLGMLALSNQSQAALLNFNFDQSKSDTLSSGIDFTYNAMTNMLTGSGFADSYRGENEAHAPHNIGNNGGFTLSAEIDELGVLSSGTLAITGTVVEHGFTSGTLLVGTLTDFGFDSNGTLDFLFTATGGDALSLYGGKGGIIITSSGFNGFTSNWNSGILGSNAYTVIVPVPAAVWLFGSGLIGLVGVARRSSKKQA